MTTSLFINFKCNLIHVTVPCFLGTVKDDVTTPALASTSANTSAPPHSLGPTCSTPSTRLEKEKLKAGFAPLKKGNRKLQCNNQKSDLQSEKTEKQRYASYERNSL